MFTRRQFLATTLGAGVTLATGAGCTVTQTGGGGKRTIVDAQVHLWKANTPDWPWVADTRPQLPEPFTIERALALMDEAGVDRVVVLPPTLSPNNDYALEAARRYPNRFAVMGLIPLQDPKSAALLPRWMEQPGMLGIRTTFNTPVSSKWLSDGTADWFWPAAEKAGIPVMFAAFGQTSKFGPIAQRHPGLQLMMDHMGLNSVLAKQGRAKEAIDEAVALARYPNVSVKMTNLVNASQESYPFRDLNEHLRRVFDAYGPQRCYWGTDITAAFAKATWRQRVTHVTEELTFLSESDKDWIMGRAIRARLKWA